MRLTTHLLLNAYSQGIFPMADDDGSIYWYDPDPRAVIPLDDRFHVPRSLARQVRKGDFQVRVDTAFREVMEACAELGPGRENTWISRGLIDVYCELHALGFAHSVETWHEGELVGGLYGVTLAGLFAGESMFSRTTNASKVALVHLVERLRRRGFVLLDTQFMTDHLRRFGTYELSRQQYKAELERALRVWARF